MNPTLTFASSKLDNGERVVYSGDRSPAALEDGLSGNVVILNMKRWQKIENNELCTYSE